VPPIYEPIYSGRGADQRAHPVPASLVYVAASLSPLKLQAFLDFAAPGLNVGLS
jgi:hypothetical protein